MEDSLSYGSLRGLFGVLQAFIPYEEEGALPFQVSAEFPGDEKPLEAELVYEKEIVVPLSSYLSIPTREYFFLELIRSKFVDLIARINKTVSHQIVSDLFATRIFNQEEMNYVLAEPLAQGIARTLITVVLNKGEESCKYFLQSLENNDSFLFNDLMGNNVLGRVTDEDLEDLGIQLKRLYSSKFFQNVYPLGEEIDIIFDLEATFICPLLWRKDTFNQRRQQLTLEDVLNTLESPCIIEGEAGKGKTTMLKRIAFLWARGKCQALNQYKLVFFITLRSTSEGLYETMRDQLFPVTYNWNKKEFLAKIWKLGPKVLFLFDGYDEFSQESCIEVDDLIKQNYKYGSTVIVTTRTESLKEVRHCASLIVETGDFTIEGAKTLISNVLQEEEAAGLLAQLEETEFMKNLMKTPLFVVIACALRMGESDFHMSTQTTLFCTLYNLMIERSHDKIKDIKKQVIEQNISWCGDLALKGLFDHKYEFRKEHLGNIVEGILLKMGLLNMYGAQKPQPIYRFFHTSFQEYTAGRRLSHLLSSTDDSCVEKANFYLSKIQTLNDVTSRYKNLLFYTCGSSKAATQKVINFIRSMCIDGIDDQNSDFVDFGINLFYESATQMELSKEFEPLFSGRTLHLNTYSIASHHVDFFQYLPSCLSALCLVKIDLSGFESNASTLNGELSSKPQSYISEKVVRLFFDWTQILQTMEVTLKNFDQLTRQDIRCLGRICCCAERLRLSIISSAGITGNLTKILEYCKRMQDLIIDSTLLSTDDETQIVGMTKMKILSISNVENVHKEGGLLHGLCNLVEIEKLALHNIHLNERDAEILGDGVRCLTELKILKLSDLPRIGNGLELIIESISCHCLQIKDLFLNNCCLTANALTTLSKNLKNLRKLEVLDFSENYLEGDGKLSIIQLGMALTQLPALTTLILPGGTNVKSCLEELICQLKRIPKLSNLAFRRWNLLDDDAITLATHLGKDFTKISCLDLSCNNIGNDGWNSLIRALQNLKDLRHFNLSTEGVFSPIGDVVQILCTVTDKLPSLKSLELNNWELESTDLSKMKNAKLIHRKSADAYKHSFKVENR
ncbi:NLR family CARD domain-containing protein 4 [Gastrophryne carolinensis]